MTGNTFTSAVPQKSPRHYSKTPHIRRQAHHMSVQVQEKSFVDQGGRIAGLDGLRSLAVVAVLLYHVFPGLVRGGFLGVDVFFVISGFLITTLLLREFNKKKKLDIIDFYIRRLRRIIPSLITLTLLIVPCALFTNKDLLVGIGRQILGALTFSTNWLEIAHGSNYFDTTAPLLFKNFWSLAIEEQFYIIWPLVFLVIVRCFKTAKSRALLPAVLALISAGLMAVFFSPSMPTRVYYGTHTHLFGLALGICLAFSYGSKDGGWLSCTVWKKTGQHVGLPLLALLIFCMLSISDTSVFAYRGGMFLASLITMLIIASLIHPHSYLVSFLDKGVFRWLGSRSYGLYLWHWPVLVIFRLLVVVPVGTWLYAVQGFGAVALSLLICELSYRFVENPFRKQGILKAVQHVRHALTTRLSSRLLALGVFTLCVLTVVAVIVAPQKTSTQQMIEENEKKMADAQAVDTNASPERNASGSLDQKVREKNSTAEEDKKSNAKTVGGLLSTLDLTEPAYSDITVIGDSMVSASATGIEYAMPGVVLLGKPNRQWGEAHDVIESGLENNQIGRVAILCFGTNAGVTDVQLVRDAILQLGENRVILLVNLYSPSTFIDEANAVYAQMAEEYPNVGVIDWHSVAASNPGGLLGPDSTHTTILGANTFGELLRDDSISFVAELREKREQAEKAGRSAKAEKSGKSGKSGKASKAGKSGKSANDGKSGRADAKE